MKNILSIIVMALAATSCKEAPKEKLQTYKY